MEEASRPRSNNVQEPREGLPSLAEHWQRAPLLQVLPLKTVLHAARLSDMKWYKLKLMLGISDVGSEDCLTGKPLPSNWIIDTGASSHVTGDLSILFDTVDISGSPIVTPDGKILNAIKRGRVRLSANLVLTNVLYVPQFTCNLIFVAQLADTLDCVIHFTKIGCIIQDHISRTLIGLGERRNGLYYFCSILETWVLHVDGKVSSALWHRRLGHPSDKVVRSLSFISNSCQLSNKACIVCHQTKQSRDSFVSSEYQATRSFELIHCDVWGSYHTLSSCGARYFLTIVDNYSRVAWLFLLIDRTEVSKYFMQFLAC
ncbi:hypothetical protein LIER_20949 [Lithospermum erythrorhizon]|uniref:Retrovirus-related Pol polyprotein from transposon TNT 1-94 n=1 Tax=Lithospermum erythrorhizon TaxID=34254 RepID=A0AAV3QQU2_LITER